MGENVFSGKDRQQLNQQLNRIEEWLELVQQQLYSITHAAHHFAIKQLIGGKEMANLIGIPVGGSGTFTVTLVPPGSALQAGSTPSWATDDTANVTLTVSLDGLSCQAAVGAGATAGTSFNFTVSGINSAGSPISSSKNCPILPAVPTPATGFDIEQVSSVSAQGHKVL